MDTLLQDVRYALRMIQKARVFNALVVLIVALSVGAATTIFSIVEGSLLWDENPNVGRWVLLSAHFPRQNLRAFHFSPAEYFDFRQLTDVFESVGAARGFNSTLFIDDAPQFMQGTLVTADMIPMTAIAPLMGRIFTPEDDQPGAPKTTVLTYEIWQHRLNGDPNILGKSLRIDNDHYTVVGVMPPHYGLWGGELYLPFRLNPAVVNRSDRHVRVVALIRKGISADQLNARLDQFARGLERGYAATNPEYQGMKVSTWNIKEAVIGGVRPLLLILMEAVGLIIAIACANIGNLLLAKANARRREMAVRAALGAGRWRIVRQLLTESILLGLAGGTVGALLARWGVPAAVSLVGETQLPYSEQIRLDWAALLLALAVAVIMGMFFGLAPAIYAGRRDLAQAIREGGLQAGSSREGRWSRATLVVSQVALAMVVLTGAGLMIRSYRELLRLDVGYDTHNALTAQLALPADKYSTGEKVIIFYRELIEKLNSSPGIGRAAVASGRPLLERVTDVATQDFFLAGHEGEKNVPNANLRVVTPGFFDVVGVRLLRGRLFNESDTAQTEPVVVVNKTMANLYWPKQDAVGQTIRLGAHYSSDPDSSAGRWVKIVGVLADARQIRVIDVPVRQEIFFPLAQRSELARGVMLIVRSKLATDSVTAILRQAVASVDPERPIFDVITLEQAVSQSFATRRVATVLLGMFAFVAITLASVGIYALVAYSVTQQTRDIGIRIALGARPRDVLYMSLSQGWRLALIGLGTGCVGALAATRLMRSIVYGVSTTDPITLAVTGVLLAAIALLASYVPARRATQIDPMSALRYE